jgi:hypothetical protein
MGMALMVLIRLGYPHGAYGVILMKLVIFGSRPQYIPRSMNLNQQADLIARAIDKFGLVPSEVVTGMAQGIDTAAIVYARRAGLALKGMRADWDNDGKAAGKIRNKQMAMYADAGLGLQWDNSPGTQHMIDVMKSLREPCYTVHDGNLDYAF